MCTHCDAIIATIQEDIRVNGPLCLEDIAITCMLNGIPAENVTGFIADVLERGKLVLLRDARDETEWFNVTDAYFNSKAN